MRLKNYSAYLLLAGTFLLGCLFSGYSAFEYNRAEQLKLAHIQLDLQDADSHGEVAVASEQLSRLVLPGTEGLETGDWILLAFSSLIAGIGISAIVFISAARHSRLRRELHAQQIESCERHIRHLRHCIKHIDQSVLLFGNDGALWLSNDLDEDFPLVPSRARRSLAAFRSWLMEVGAPKPCPKRDSHVRDGRLVVKPSSGHYFFFSETEIPGTGTLITASDVTDALERQQAIDERLEVIEAQSDGVLVLQDGRIRYANTAAASILGGTVDETVGKHWTAVLAPDAFGSDIRQALKGKGQTKVEQIRFWHSRPDGIRLPLGLTLTKGKTHKRIAVLRDRSIDEYHAACIAQERDHFEQIVNAVPGVVYRWHLRPDGSSRYEYLSARCEEILGIPGHDLVAGFESLVHEDDLDRYQDEMERLRLNGGEWQFDGRIIRPDQQTIWIRSHAVSHRADDGTLILTGIINDVTASRRMEEALRYTNERYAEVSEAAGELIWETNKSGLITYVSGPVEETLGYSADSLIGRQAGMLMIPEDFAKWSAKREVLLKDPRAFKDFAATFADNQGRHRPHRISGTPKFDSKGQCTGFRGVAMDITEQVQTEIENNLIFEVNRAILCVMDLRGSVTRVNEAAERLLGYAPRELTGTYLVDLIHPDDRQTFEQWHRLLLQDEPVEGQCRVRHADGSWHWLDWLIAPKLDKRFLVASGRDITEHKHHLKQLKSATRIARLGSWEVDLCRGTLLWDEELCRMHQIPPDHPPPPRFDDWSRFFHAKTWNTFRNALHHAAGTVEHLPSLVLEMHTHDGETRWIRVGGEFEQNDDQSLRLVGTVQDTTRSTNDELEKARIQAKLAEAQKMEAIGHLANGIAHDFNNVLAVILSRAEHLETLLPKHHPDLAQHARMIKSAGRSGSEIVEKLLSRSKSDIPSDASAGAIDAAKTVLAGAEICRELMPANVTIQRPGIKARNNRVKAAHSMIMSAAQNFILNARDAMASTGGTIAITVCHNSMKQSLSDLNLTRHQLPCGHTIHLAELEDGGMFAIAGDNLDHDAFVSISVEDQGVGMDLTRIRKCFIPNFTTKGHKGAGIGLAHTLTAAVEAGGLIKIESRLGQGTTFSLLLPHVDIEPPRSTVTTDGIVVNSDSPIRANQAFSPAEGATAISGRRPCALVVDDSEKLAAELAGSLEILGYEASYLTDPEDASALVEEDPEGWQIIILDEAMPKLRGHQLAQRIRRAGYQGRLILCSSYAGDINSSNASEYGFNYYLAKPVSQETLKEALGGLLEPSSSGASGVGALAVEAVV